MFILVFFFFQAEDGIRDLVRSRGLGDVYKRQVRDRVGRVAEEDLRRRIQTAVARIVRPEADAAGAVSYTHLTLPTSDLV